ncbi:helix-turn-helix transcriptional regulator [Plantactinospora sp. KLBMP9567]|uniref:helix-turn-helix domain-containing protein n=1 Tax=Plantactinospora sp. KLBMP9567 TaxID=3085900 RepID=UPI0029816D9D|nr:helix-turn-helix transcriptional regulator [Plantactinospora sp. KLBMP9567]MDW5322817.1 helix-turn-helix transcriptional regulator [Plantactinospora sp. KLBMP9567]
MNDQPPSLPARIRELRTQRKLSQDRLAAAIGVAKSTVQSFESGKLIPQEGTAQRLDEVFGTGSEIQGLAKTAHEDRTPWMRPWVEHELRAILLQSWEPMLIPGLVQREPYMREVFNSIPRNRNRIDEMVSTRLNRQAAVLERDPSVAVTCLIGEFALRQGSREALKDQLSHLIDVGHRSSAKIRIVVGGMGIHAGLGGPLALATMPDGRRVGYLDDQLRGRVATSPADVTELALLWEEVDGLALSVDQSRDMMLRMINELK